MRIAPLPYECGVILSREKEQAMRLRRRMKAWLAVLDERPEEIKALIEAAEASPPPRRRWLKAWRLARRCLALGLTLDDPADNRKEPPCS